MELIHTYGPDYKVILVGDATMSPYEIVQPGGSVEHWNEEVGQAWLARILRSYRHSVWLNPQPQDWWESYESIRIVNRLMGGRMYPLTLSGLDDAIRELSH